MKTLLTIVFLATLVPSGTLAQPLGLQCDDRINVIKRLAKKYQEARIALGATLTGGMLELYATESGSTWTITISTQTGSARIQSCVIAAGENWRSFMFELPGDPPI